MKLWQLILNIAILLLVIGCAVKIWATGKWEEHVVELAYGFAGVIGYFFPYEWSSWHGYRAWGMDQWRFQPEDWIRATSFIAIILYAIRILF